MFLSENSAHLSNLWHADNQGASSQNGYQVCPTTRLYDQKMCLTYFGLKHQKKWKLQFFIFMGNLKSMIAPLCNNPKLTVTKTLFLVNTEPVKV